MDGLLFKNYFQNLLSTNIEDHSLVDTLCKDPIKCILSSREETEKKYF